MAACPAGDDVIGPFLADRKGFLREVVNPLQDKEEPVYVIPGSDAEAYVTKRFPHKRPRRVGGGRRPRSIRSFLFALPHLFQRHASEGLDATYHFTFTGEEPAEATVVIRDKAIRVEPGHVGTPDLRVRADSRTWLGFLAKERSLVCRGGFVGEVVEPLRAKEEPVYVIPGSDAEAYVTRRFPHKRPRRVGGGRRPRWSGRSCSPCRTCSSGTPRRGWTPPTTSRSPGTSRRRRRS